MDTSKLLAIGALGALLFAAYRYGSPEMKGAALGVAGMVVINQLPIVRDGLQARLVA